MGEYERFYSGLREHPLDGVEAFLQKVAKVTDATTLHIYSLGPTMQYFQVEAGVGTPLFDNLEREYVDRCFDFEDGCLVYLDSSTEVQALKTRLATPHVLCVVTYMLQAIPGLIVYDFPLPADEDLIWELCSFASREIIHLIRSSRLGNQFRILTSLTTLGHIHSDKRKLLSQILFRLQEFFKADGVSLIEVLTVEHMKFRLKNICSQGQRRYRYIRNRPRHGCIVCQGTKPSSSRSHFGMRQCRMH
jgi:hypothetical protein